MIARAAQAFYYLLLAPALLPLVYLDGVMYPMMAPKTILLRAFGIVAAALFVYLVANGRPFFWARLQMWYTLLPGALLAVAYLSSLLGIDFYHSFWSTFERGDGLLTLTVCVGYFYLILLSADEVFTRRLLKAVAWVGSIAGFYVLLQWVNVYSGADLSFIAKTSGRIGGTMGNAAFLAAYLAVAFFATLAVAREYGGNLRTLLYAGAIFELLGILLAATRGTLVALIGIAVAVLAHEAVRGEGVRRTWALRSLVGVGAALILLVVFNGPLSQVPIEPVRRIASISLDDGTVSSRLFLWQNLLPEALKSPLYGMGAEQISTAFNRVYDPTKIAEEWFDRSHNAYLDYFIQFGVLGLSLYLALIALAVVKSWRLARTLKRDDPWRRYATLLLFGFVVYALQNVFVFDTGVTLWLFLSFVALVFAKASPASPSRLLESTNLGWVGALVGVILLAALVPAALQPIRANLLAFEAYLYHVVDIPRTNAAIDKGLSLATYADLEFGYNAYFMYTNEQRLLSGTEKEEAYAKTVEVLRKNFERYSYDARTVVYLLHVIEARPQGTKVDDALLHQAIETATKVSQKRPAAWYILANLAIEKAESLPSGAEKSALYQGAVDTLRTYLVLVPDFAEPHFVLADLYTALGQGAKAAEEAALGKEVYRPHLATAKRAAVYYEKLGDWENAEFFLEAVIAEDPSAHVWRYDLAKAKYLLDDFAGAAEIVRYLRETNPAILETDPAFLAAIAPYEPR